MAPPERPAPMLSGLLARKGEARPAMRNNGLAAALVQDDDLGWNDFGAGTDAIPSVLRQRAQLQALETGSDAAGARVTIALDPARVARLCTAAAAAGCTVDAFVATLIDRLPPTDPVPTKVQP